MIPRNYVRDGILLRQHPSRPGFAACCPRCQRNTESTQSQRRGADAEVVAAEAAGWWADRLEVPAVRWPFGGKGAANAVRADRVAHSRPPAAERRKQRYAAAVSEF